jgi:V/A-type H+-transporting ATPase subunit C
LDLIMSKTAEKAVIDFYRYPPVGQEDWKYAFATANVRALETTMISKGTFIDMANADSFASAMELLGGSEYALGTISSFKEVEEMLLERRSAVRSLFVELIEDKKIIELLRAREDFANMRLAVRRVVTERPIGTDYSDEGSVPADDFEEIFETENYSRFPEYLQEAVEKAVLGYYQAKDIREIDHAIDHEEAAYRLRKADELDSVFLRSLFRMRIDLTNIRTMLRLKMADRDEREHFMTGGFVEVQKFVHGIDLGYEAIPPLFFATPYYDIIESGINYLTSEHSFLGLEEMCEEHMIGFLKSTSLISSGPQPIIAYTLLKEIEIRTLRMVLTCKNNDMDAKTILDRLSLI